MWTHVTHSGIRVARLVKLSVLLWRLAVAHVGTASVRFWNNLERFSSFDLAGRVDGLAAPPQVLRRHRTPVVWHCSVAQPPMVLNVLPSALGYVGAD